MLARVGATQEEISAATRIHRVRIAEYKTATRRPGPINRARLLKHFGIPMEAWDQEPQATPTPSTAPLSGPASIGFESVIARANRLQTMVDGVLDGVLQDPTSTPLEKLRAAEKASSIAATLGRLTGASQEMSEAKILRLPMWRRIEAAVIEALRPIPGALQAFHDACQKLDG